ncbi:MAG: class I tRNA ligase family protein, partial [Bdellovibrionota bacterium]
LHAMVRDEKGQKMSKTRGNTIDPLDLIAKHGADPLRFTLLAMAGQGRDIKLSVDRVEGYRAFCNKLWNAVKFFHLQYDGGVVVENPDGTKSVEVNLTARKALAPDPVVWLTQNRKILSASDRWILSRLATTVETVERNLAAFEMDEAARSLYEFTWGELCDWYVELSKHAFRQGGAAREAALNTLFHVEETLLRLLHPLMPFVTEELWQSLPADRIPVTTPVRTLMAQRYPGNLHWRDESAEKSMQSLQALINAIRNFRGENNVSPKVGLKATFHTLKGSPEEAFIHDTYNSTLLRELCRFDRLEPPTDRMTAIAPHEALISVSGTGIDFRVDLRGVVDTAEEIKRLKKEIEKTKGDLDFIQSKLAKESFVAKAPPELIAKEKSRAEDVQRRLGELQASLGKLEKLATLGSRA